MFPFASFWNSTLAGGVLSPGFNPGFYAADPGVAYPGVGYPGFLGSLGGTLPPLPGSLDD